MDSSGKIIWARHNEIQVRGRPTQQLQVLRVPEPVVMRYKGVLL